MTPVVSSNPRIMGGELCVRGTRIPIRMLVSRRLYGESVKSIAEDFDRTPREIRAALAWAAARGMRLRVRKADVHVG